MYNLTYIKINCFFKLYQIESTDGKTLQLQSNSGFYLIQALPSELGKYPKLQQHPVYVPFL